MASAITEKHSQRPLRSHDQPRSQRGDRSVRRKGTVDSIPGTKPRFTSRNLLVGATYLLALTVLVSILVTIRISYRPYSGC